MKKELLFSADTSSLSGYSRGLKKPGFFPTSRKGKIGASIIAAAIILIGCLWLGRLSVLKLIYEIHDPAVENSQTILKAAQKYKLNTEALVVVAPQHFQSMLKAYNASIPDALILDRQGNYITYRITPQACNANLFSFIPALEKDGRYTITGKTDLQEEMRKFRDLKGNELGYTFLNPHADYYVFISWATFIGKLNKDHVKVWEDLASGNLKANIQVINVNMDVQQWWPHEAQDSLLKMHKKL